MRQLTFIIKCTHYNNPTEFREYPLLVSKILKNLPSLNLSVLKLIIEDKIIKITFEINDDNNELNRDILDVILTQVLKHKTENGAFDVYFNLDENEEKKILSNNKKIIF